MVINDAEFRIGMSRRFERVKLKKAAALIKNKCINKKSLVALPTIFKLKENSFLEIMLLISSKRAIASVSMISNF